MHPCRSLKNTKTWPSNPWEIDKPFTKSLWRDAKSTIPRMGNELANAGRRNMIESPCRFDNHKVCRYVHFQCPHPPRRGIMSWCVLFQSNILLFVCFLILVEHLSHLFCSVCLVFKKKINLMIYILFMFRITHIWVTKRFEHRTRCGNWSRIFGKTTRTIEKSNSGDREIPIREFFF